MDEKDLHSTIEWLRMEADRHVSTAESGYFDEEGGFRQAVVYGLMAVRNELRVQNMLLEYRNNLLKQLQETEAVRFEMRQKELVGLSNEVAGLTEAVQDE